MIEFALLLPIFVTMIMILINVEVTISSGIVNQKYARLHEHFLSFNHRHYLEHEFLKRNGTYMRRHWSGVSENSTFNDADGKTTPVAPTVKVGKFKPGSDGEKGDVAERQHIRVRSLIFTCIPPIGPAVDQYYSTGGLSEDTFTSGKYRHCED